MNPCPAITCGHENHRAAPVPRAVVDRARLSGSGETAWREAPAPIEEALAQIAFLSDLMLEGLVKTLLSISLADPGGDDDER